MDSQIQGLEFLDWDGLAEDDRSMLQMILYGIESQQQQEQEQQEEELPPQQHQQQQQQEWVCDNDVAMATQEEVWTQQQEGYDVSRGEVPMYHQPMVPPMTQQNTAVYQTPCVMLPSPGVIVGNLNLNVNANVQSFMQPVQSHQYHQSQVYEPKENNQRRSSKPKSKRQHEDQYPPHHYMYNQAYSYVQHNTAQHVSGPPLYISAQVPMYNTQQPVYYQHPQMYIPMSMPPVMEASPIPEQHTQIETPIIEHVQQQNEVIIQQQQQQQQQKPPVIQAIPPPSTVTQPPPTPVITHHPQPQPTINQTPIIQQSKPPIKQVAIVEVPKEPTIEIPVEKIEISTNRFKLDDVKAALPPFKKQPEVPTTVEVKQEVEIPVEEKVVESPPPTTKPVMKSWASIVQSNQASPLQESPSNGSNKPLARVSPFTPSSGPGAVIVDSPLAKTKAQMTPQDHMMDDPALYRLGEYLCHYQLDHRSSPLQPRGLTNRSNWCYVNATLQALLACPPFFNLMRNLPTKQRNNLKHNPKSATPIIDAVVEFMQEFSILPPNSRPARKEKAAARKGEEGAVIDVPQGPAFEPSCVYSMLASIRSAAFKVEGRQEDAEEFLSCLLNALNDEMLELMKLVDNLEEEQIDNNTEVNNAEQEDDDQWTVMRSRNRACLTRRSDFGRTPVSDIFRGQLCSHVQRKGEQQSENVQPFYTLQLDIELVAAFMEMEDEEQQEQEANDIIVLMNVIGNLQELRVSVSGFVSQVVPLMSDIEFKRHFRMSKQSFQELVDIVGPSISPAFTGGRPALPADVQVMIALWHLGNAEVHRKSSQLFNCSMSTAWISVLRVCEAITAHKHQFISWPTEEEMILQQRQFQEISGIPNVVGCIDCSEMITSKPLYGPRENENRNGDYSIKLQAICGTKKEFFDIYVGEAGSVHDSRVFQRSPIGTDLANAPIRQQLLPNNSHLLGDSAYSLSPYMIVPYRTYRNLNDRQRNFNFHHSRTRIVIENSYALLRGKFRCLQYLYRFDPEIAPVIVFACCCLHNFCIARADDIDMGIPAGEPIVNIFNANQSGADKREAIANLLMH